MTRTLPIQRRARVLIADDASAIRSVLTRRLGRLFQLWVARDGQEALDMVRAASTPMDLVLTDIAMPRMTGLELFAAFRDLSPELARRTVFMSGTFDEPDVRRTVEAYGVLLIRKPFDLDGLSEQLVELLETMGLCDTPSLASTA